MDDEIPDRKSTPVSLIICAKNEEQNLTSFLPLISEQDYSEFEIVLVNDDSDDQTLKVMQEFKSKMVKLPNISDIIILDLPKHQNKGKKYALTQGIKATNHQYLLVTDADCKPVSKEWISTMSAYFSNEKTIVLGYSPYKKIKNSFLNKLIRFETLLTAIQYFSYAKAGIPYMGVGRNMAFHKNEFNKVDGFKKHNHIASGDDDLFIAAAASKINTAICFEKKSFTESLPNTSFINWFQQKRRHISTATHYKKIHQFLLGLFFSSQFLFWTLAIFLVIFQINIQITLLLIGIRFIAWFLTVSSSAKKLDETDLLIFAPFFEISLIFTQLCIFIANLLQPKNKW
ncbi:MAG: glycosyltransferase [Bacteroidota bacterium]